MLHINRPAGLNVLGPTFKADKKIAAVWTPSSASAGNRSNYQTSADNCPCKPESLNKLVSPLETLTSPSNSHATFKSVATLDARFAQSEEKNNENLIETTSQAALARPVASPVPAPPPPPPKPPSHLSPDNPRRHPAVSPANDQPAIPSLLDYLAPSGPNAEESSASSNQQISEESSPRLSAFVEFDPFRSVIEYPEKQTVAELRNKLETKFNGSMPVKGYMTASGQIIRPEPTRPAVAPRTNMSKIDYRFQPPPGDLYSTLMNQPIATEQPKPNNQSELSPARASHVATTKIDRGLATKTTTRDYYDDSSEKKPNRSDDVLKSTVDDLRRCIEGAKNAVAREVANSEVPFGFSAKIEERPKSEDKFGMSRINDERARFFESFNPPQPRNGLIRPTEQPNFVRSPSPPRVPPPPQNYSVGVYAETGKLIDHSQRHRFAMENCTGPQNKFYPDQIILPATSDSFSEAEWRPRDYGTTREIKDHHLEKEGQHAWYKEMYQQIHHIDRKNDESILRYQMKDYLANANAAADKYAAKESAIQPCRRTNQGDDGHIITYKFSDLRNQTDLGEPNHRRMRSKSASRFENPVLSPPHSDVVRCSSPGERYKHQPKKIEDYVPGTSSVADYEQGKNRHVMASTRCQSSLAYVSGCSRPLSPLVQRFQQEPIGFRGPLGHVTNPAQLLQVRQQYKDVQTGGEVPVSGLSHLGSEMMDSWLRTALLTNYKQRRVKSPLVDASCQTLKFPDPTTTTLKIAKRDLHGFNQFTGGAIRPLSIYCEPIDRFGSNFRPNSSPIRHCSPVRGQTPGSKMYAWERMNVKDFHVPDFRRPRPRSKTSSFGHSPRSIDYEIEAYFEYLRLFCQEESEREMRKSRVVAAHGGHFAKTCDLVENSLKNLHFFPNRTNDDDQCGPDCTYQSSLSSLMRSSSLPLAGGRESSLRCWSATPAQSECVWSDLDNQRIGKIEEDAIETTAIFSGGNGNLNSKRVSSLPHISERSNGDSMSDQNVMQESLSAENFPSTSNDYSGDLECKNTINMKDNRLLEAQCNHPSRLMWRKCDKKQQKSVVGTKSYGQGSDYSPTLFNKQAGNKSVGTMPDREFDELAKLEKELVLENERRKKFEKELNDQRSRRHGYVPSKIQTPLMTDQRFDRLLTDYGERSSPGLSSEFRGVARALYPFTAHTPKELSFFKGDLIKIKRAIDANWYEGKLRGVVGIVPANYVELLATAAGDERLVVTEVQKKREGQGIALYNFDGYGLNEIPLRKNEIVRLTRRVDEHWYEGRNDMGRKGIFPANYVRVLQEPSTQLKDYVSALAAEDYSPMPSQSQPGTEFKIQFPASSTSAPSDYSAQGAAPSSAQRPIPVKYAGSGGGGNFVSLSDRRSPNLAGVGGSGNTDDLSIDTQFRSIDPSNANADLYSPPGGGVGGNAGGDGTTYVRRNVYDSHKTTYKRFV